MVFWLSKKTGDMGQSIILDCKGKRKEERDSFDKYLIWGKIDRWVQVDIAICTWIQSITEVYVNCMQTVDKNRYKKEVHS